MIENYVNTLEAIQLFVYSNGARVSADATPTATAVDTDTEATVQLSAVTVVNHPDGYDYYEVNLDPTEVTYRRCVAVTWEYVLNGDTYNRVDIVDVVRPYFYADEFWQAYPEFDSTGENPMSIDEVAALERQVRYRIDRYCLQEFQDFDKRTVRMRGNGTNALTLMKPIYKLESVKAYNGELVLFSRDASGNVDVNLVEWEPEYDAHITKVHSGIPIPNRFEEDPTGFSIYRTRSLFKNNRYYEVEAFFGWKYLPSEVGQAALILANELAQPEDRYRQKNITVVRSSDYRLEFGTDHNSTTGNVDADSMLAKYVREGVYVF